jgi:hypothetical protein
MPTFQASLIDPSTSVIDVSLDQECSILTFEDNSNYTASDEVGHLEADFSDYRQLIITSPDGTTYGYDAEGGLDEVWTPGNSGSNEKTRTLAVTDTDGVYVLTLYTVPTYNAGVEYTHTTANPKAVYYNGKLWRTLQTTPSGNTPATGSTFWESIEKEDLSSKYFTEATFALTCRNLLQCLEEKTKDAVCACEADNCDDDLLCNNHNFLQAVKLKTILDGVDYASSNSDFCEATNLINLAKSICDC